MSGQQFADFAKELRDDPIFADFIIACEGTEHRVHKVFVSGHSLYFRKLFKGGDFKELTAGKIELKEDSPKAVAFMVDYFYCSDYSDEHENNAGFSSILELNAAVYVVAEKYEVPGLKTLAAKKFAIAARPSITNKESPFGAIKLIFNQTPQTDTLLREITIQYWTIYGSMCLENDPDLSSKFLLHVPDFAATLINRATTVSGISFVASCTMDKWRPSLRVTKASELWTKKCGFCEKPVGEHEGLKMLTQSTTVEPFWMKWLE